MSSNKKKSECLDADVAVCASESRRIAVESRRLLAAVNTRSPSGNYYILGNECVESDIVRVRPPIELDELDYLNSRDYAMVSKLSAARPMPGTLQSN